LKARYAMEDEETRVQSRYFHDTEYRRGEMLNFL
jgi:hypothetical protein